ncbi:MAG: hypothetical protein ACK5Y2_01530, partial [Bdellovibrionales bacterium]
ISFTTELVDFRFALSDEFFHCWWEQRGDQQMLRLDRTLKIFKAITENIGLFGVLKLLAVDLFGRFQYGLLHWVAPSFFWFQIV